MLIRHSFEKNLKSLCIYGYKKQTPQKSLLFYFCADLLPALALFLNGCGII